MTTTKTLLSAILASLLVCTAAAAEDTLRTAPDNGKQRTDVTLNGNSGCVLIEHRIFCAPVVKPVHVAASDIH
ncbi:MAG: hypothetical protein ACREUQ_09405 [Burkholderiales bacterium]